MSISVLIVEDNAELQSRLRALLEAEGYVVHSAQDPDEAIEFLGRLPRPCILLWDALMPRHSLTMVDQATMEGVHVAILPVSVATVHAVVGAQRQVHKRLTSEEAVLDVVRANCPLAKASA